MSSIKLNLSDFMETGDATKLSNLDNKTFTIVAVQDRPYEDTPGVEVTTKETCEFDGKRFNKLVRQGLKEKTFAPYQKRK